MLIIHLFNKQLNFTAIKASGTKPRIQESSEYEEKDIAQDTYMVKLKD